MRVVIAKYNKIRGISILAIVSLILIPSAISLIKRVLSSVQEQSSSTLSIENFEIEFENVYSLNLKNKIHDFVRDLISKESLLSFDQNNFYAALKYKFPIIKKFDSQINKHSLKIKITGTEPFCLINKEMVLGNKKQLFPVTLFDQFDITSLNNISVNNKFLSQNIYTFIKQIPKQYLQNYEINFTKPSEIYLTPKNPVLKYFFVTNKKTIFDEEKFAKAQQLYQMLMHTKKVRFKKNQMFLMDLRFKNRIITRLEDSIREGGG
jgi:hypothetical protein